VLEQRRYAGRCAAEEGMVRRHHISGSVIRLGAGQRRSAGARQRRGVGQRRGAEGDGVVTCSAAVNMAWYRATP
jgi:hypothetical protein